MTSVAYLPIVADRYGPLVRHLYVAGLDLTGVTMRAQVRFSGDSPGAPYVDLLTVTNGNAQGLRLVEVTTDDLGLPTSHVEIVINETTMEGLPYAGELGDAVQLAWDMQITLAGRKRRLAKGEFEITGDGVTGADAAPVDRPIGYGRPVQPITSPWKAARLTFGEEQVTVQIVDADLVAPLVKAAKTSADSAEADAALAATAAASAQAVTRYFTTRAAGEVASAIDQAFATDDGAGNVIYYRRTAGGSAEIGRAVTPAALADGAGAGRVGFDRTKASVPATVIDRLLRDLYITDAPYSIALDGSDQSASFNQMLANLPPAGGGGWNIVVPRGYLRLNAKVQVPSHVHISGQFYRSAILYLGAGGGFVFDSVEHAGLHKMRVSLDEAPNLDAVTITTTTTPTINLDFSDLEIVGAGIEHQRGFAIDAINGRTIEECTYRNLRFAELDQAIHDYDSEGGSWIGCLLNHWGYGSAKPALDLRTLATKHDFDVRGQPVAGSVAYKQLGSGNWANLIADIKASCTAILMPNSPNHLSAGGIAPNFVFVRRAENLTPLGSFAPGHTVVDNGALMSGRALVRGTLPTGAAFVMDGFGNEAYAKVLKGDDQGGRFVIHAAGAGIGQNPTVTYFNVDGPYPFPPATLLIQRNGGNQPSARGTFNRNCGVNGWNFQAEMLPIAGEAYEWDYLVR